MVMLTVLGTKTVVMSSAVLSVLFMIKGEGMCDSANEELVGEILDFLKEGPAHFEDILNRFQDAKYRDILRAWGVLRKNDQLGREMETGKYILKTVDSQ